MKKVRLMLIMALAVMMAVAVFAGCQPAEVKLPVDEPTNDEPTNDEPIDEEPAVEDWAYISGKGEMIVGITYYEPMNYLDADGNLTGFDTEFTIALCEELGITPNFVVINWDTKEIELAAMTIDCIWNGLTVREDRKENMDFTQSYIKNKQVAVIRVANADMYTDVESMAGARLTAEAGSAGESVIQETDALKNANYTGVSYQANALLEVKAGTADVAVIDYVMAKAMVGEGTDYSDLMIVPNVELAIEEYAIGFRKNSPETLQIVNAAINKLIQSGKLNEIAEKYGLADSLLANQ